MKTIKQVFSEGFSYLIDERVIIPRPETETIVDLALQHLNQKSAVLELGTGSGAIALSIAKEGNVEVLATDISEEALEIARINAEINNINKVEWLQSDWFSNIESRYDLIISNPPYVSEAAYQNLAPEIKDYEPAIALTDNVDGFSFFEADHNRDAQPLNQ